MDNREENTVARLARGFGDWLWPPPVALIEIILVWSLAAAAIFLTGQNGRWALLLTALALLATLVAYQMHRTQGQDRQRSILLQGLEELSRQLLGTPPDEADLPQALQDHLPGLFPGWWLEIRLLPDRDIYFQGRNWSPAADEVWQRLAELRTPYLTLRDAPLALGDRLRGQAILVPISSRENGQVLGGILAQASPRRLPAREPLALLANQIAADIYRADRFEAALAALEEVYKEEIFAQTYETELVAEYQRITQELALAREIQRGLLPKALPDVPGWQLDVQLEPAREASGDFYDVIPLRDGRLGLLVADVADKGLGPALYMAVCRTLIRTFAQSYDDPAQVLTATNARMVDEAANDLFVTLFYGVLDPESGRLTYSNAGHNPAYLLTAATEAGEDATDEAAGGGPRRVATRALGNTGVPLGLFTHLPWETAETKILPGDLLVLYTDGVTEAHDEALQLFGEERLQQVARDNLGRPADMIAHKVLSAVNRFMGDRPQLDDITLMVLAREKLGPDDSAA